MKTVLCATLVGIFCALSVGATTLVRMTEEEMTDQAEVIVAGKCDRLESRWVGRTLFTLATISVEETFKGQEAPELTVAIPGGVDLGGLAPVSVVYPGAPVIAPGEDVVLFLEPSGAVEDGYSVVGFSQGKLVATASRGGEPVALRQSGGSASLTFAQLRELVRSVLKPSTIR